MLNLLMFQIFLVINTISYVLKSTPGCLPKIHPFMMWNFHFPYIQVPFDNLFSIFSDFAMCVVLLSTEDSKYTLTKL